jgi:hypothetical protein
VRTYVHARCTRVHTQTHTHTLRCPCCLPPFKTHVYFGGTLDARKSTSKVGALTPYSLTLHSHANCSYTLSAACISCFNEEHSPVVRYCVGKAEHITQHGLPLPPAAQPVTLPDCWCQPVCQMLASLHTPMFSLLSLYADVLGCSYVQMCAASTCVLNVLTHVGFSMFFKVH